MKKTINLKYILLGLLIIVSGIIFSSNVKAASTSCGDYKGDFDNSPTIKVKYENFRGEDKYTAQLFEKGSSEGKEISNFNPTMKEIGTNGCPAQFCTTSDYSVEGFSAGEDKCFVKDVVSCGEEQMICKYDANTEITLANNMGKVKITSFTLKLNSLSPPSYGNRWQTEMEFETENKPDNVTVEYSHSMDPFEVTFRNSSTMKYTCPSQLDYQLFYTYEENGGSPKVALHLGFSYSLGSKWSDVWGKYGTKTAELKKKVSHRTATLSSKNCNTISKKTYNQSKHFIYNPSASSYKVRYGGVNIEYIYTKSVISDPLVNYCGFYSGSDENEGYNVYVLQTAAGTPGFYNRLLSLEHVIIKTNDSDGNTVAPGEIIYYCDTSIGCSEEYINFTRIPIFFHSSQYYTDSEEEKFSAEWQTINPSAIMIYPHCPDAIKVKASDVNNKNASNNGLIYKNWTNITLGDSDKVCKFDCRNTFVAPPEEGNSKIENIFGIWTEKINCEEHFNKTRTLLNKVFKYFRIGGVLLFVLLSSVEYIKAMAASDAGAFKKANSKVIKRVIALIIILLLPALIKLILAIIQLESGTCGVGV